MNSKEGIFYEWGQFAIGEIYPICCVIGALIGAYKGYEMVEDSSPWSVFSVCICAFGGFVAGAIAGMAIMAIPYLAIAAGAAYGVFFVGNALYEVFGTDLSKKAPQKPIVEPVKPAPPQQPKPASPTLKKPAPQKYTPLSPPIQEITWHEQLRNFFFAIIVFGILFLIPIYLMGSPKQKPQPTPAPVAQVPVVSAEEPVKHRTFTYMINPPKPDTKPAVEKCDCGEK